MPPFLKKTILAVVIFVFLLGILLSISFHSTTVCQWFLNRAGAAVTGDLTITDIRGNLSSDILISGIDYTNDQLHLQLQQLKVRCNPWLLLKGVLKIEQIDISNSEIAVKNSIDDDFLSSVNIIFQPPTFSKLIIKYGSIDTMTLHSGHGDISIKDIFFSGNLKNSNLSIEWLKSNIHSTKISISGKAHLIEPFNYNASVSWRCLNPAVFCTEGLITLEGNRKSAQYSLTTSEPLSLNSAGRLLFNNKKVLFTGNTVETDFLSEHDSSNKFNLINELIPFSEVKFDNISFKTLSGSGVIDGTILLNETPKFNFKIQADELDPQFICPAWPGKISLDTIITGTLTDNEPMLSINDLHLEGELLALKFQAFGNIRLIGSEVDSIKLKAFSGENTIDIFSNSLGNVSFEFDFPEPSLGWPPLNGHFVGEGEIMRPGFKPEIAIKINGKNLQYGQCIVKSFHGTSSIDLANLITTETEMVFDTLQLSDKIYPHISLILSGGLKNLRTLTNIESSTANNKLDLSFVSADDVWNITVNSAVYSSKNKTRWDLISPLVLKLNSDQLEPVTACWKSKGASQCIDTFWDFDSGWHFEGNQMIPPVIFFRNLAEKILESKPKSASTTNNE